MPHDNTRLTLTRHPGEGVMIGNLIRILVTRTHGNRVQLAIEAPREVPAMRDEHFLANLEGGDA